jgi:hypothetical protein
MLPFSSLPKTEELSADDADDADWRGSAFASIKDNLRHLRHLRIKLSSPDKSLGMWFLPYSSAGSSRSALHIFSRP